MPETPDADLELALRLADAADRITLARFQAADLRVERKPDRTPVTDADTAAEDAIRAILASERPGDAVLGEERGGTLTGRGWILDPIDGTKNYSRGLPVWATLIALAEAGRPLVGVASAPAMGRRWWASAGAGAFTRDIDGTER
ncbi:MAG TPA: inositol monophosphatase family protein, partial [Pseudonocardia sp.]|nr:inositol monophosphatase family protein [Pseudonocardia sp.]